MPDTLICDGSRPNAKKTLNTEKRPLPVFGAGAFFHGQSTGVFLWDYLSTAPRFALVTIRA